MKICIYRRKKKNILKGYIWCEYHKKVYRKDTCLRCRKGWQI